MGMSGASGLRPEKSIFAQIRAAIARGDMDAYEQLLGQLSDKELEQYTQAKS